LKSLKRSMCPDTSSYHTTTYDKFEMLASKEIYSVAKAERYNYDYKKNKYSEAQDLVIRILFNDNGEISEYDLTDFFYMYDVSSNSLPSKMVKRYKELKSFKYKKYLNETETKNILKLIEGKYNQTLKAIEEFKKIVKLSGDDLVNWSGHKIARYANTNGISNRYEIESILKNIKRS